MPDDINTDKTIYFAYGSNLWIDQMNRRCPENKYIGVGVLRNWCWIINQRGYANVIPSSGDSVYGFLYELSPKDEAFLDGYEGAPLLYGKKILPIHLVSSSGDGDTTTEGSIDALVYVDIVNTSRAPPMTEYIHRINMGLNDAFQMGFSQSYVEKYIRPSIPPEY